MVFNDLHAGNFRYSTQFYVAEFEDVLYKVIDCYRYLVQDNISLENNENLIRDALLIRYLKNNDIRTELGLNDYLFDREVPEDNNIGRTDIKIQTINTFVNTEAYYTIECKRLDNTNINGITGLNGKYITNGISRFLSKTYSSHCKVNGMIGFIVAEMDINKNIDAINVLLDKILEKDSFSLLEQKNVHGSFNNCYCSIHGNIDEKITIYHLMFDFSKNILA